MTTIKHVSLDELHDDPANPRTDRTDGLPELCQSIRSLGLLTPLTVRPDTIWTGKGKKKNGVPGYRVVDGHRRLAALRIIDDEHAQIPVLVVDAGDDTVTKARAIAGNTVRVPLHPIDQFEAFAAMQEGGATVATIAGIFGLEERQVRQKLALGNLHPTIRAAWRTGNLKDDEAKAYTLTTDQQAQLKVFDKVEKQWKKQGYRGGQWEVRRLIVGETDGNTQRHARAIPAAMYEAAGGTYLNDLFSDERTPDKPELITKLYNDMWHEAAKACVAVGFTLQGFDWSTMTRYSFDVTEDQETALDNGNFEEQLAALCAAIPESERGHVFIDLNPGQGMLDIDGPWVMKQGETAKPRDLNGKLDQDEDQIPLEGEEEDAGNDTFAVSRALAEDMWKWLDKGYQAAFAADSTALLRLFIGCATGAYGQPVKFMQITFAGERDLSSKWHERLPELGPGYDTHNLLAEFTETYSVMVQPSMDRNNLHRVAALLDPESLVFSLRQHFQAEEFFQRATKGVALECLRATGGNNLHAGCKKKDFADAAAMRTRKLGWLPPLYKIGLPDSATALIKGEKAA